MSKNIAVAYSFKKEWVNKETKKKESTIVGMVFIGPEELKSTKYGGLRVGFKKAGWMVEAGIVSSTTALGKAIASASKKAATLDGPKGKVLELK